MSGEFFRRQVMTQEKYFGSQDFGFQLEGNLTWCLKPQKMSHKCFSKEIRILLHFNFRF